MKKTLLIALATVAALGVLILPKFTGAFQKNDDIKVMDYIAPENQMMGNFEIEQYEDLQAECWVNEHEVLTLEGGTPVEGSTTFSYYCSIYDLNSKESRDYTNVNIGDVYGVSDDGNFVLYSEPRFIPPDGVEWEKAYKSGDLTYKQIKVLNLETSETISIDSDRQNSDAELFWLGNKILINNWENWCIKDVDGKVYASGKYSAGELCTVSGTSNVKDCGDYLEGEFYVVDIESGKLNGISVSDCSERVIYDNGSYMSASAGKNYIVKDNGWETGKDSDKDGYEIENDPDARWSFSILDKSGTEKHKLYMDQGRICNVPIVSPNFDKAVYCDCPAFKLSNGDDQILKIIDLKTGKINDIAKLENLKNKATENKKEYEENHEDNNSYQFRADFKWDKSGNSVMFYYYSADRTGCHKTGVNTYIITFDQ